MKTTTKKVKQSKYYRQGELRLSLGNLKIGEDTLILNMGDAKTCPSMNKGMCKLGKKCYALKAERMYPSVCKYRVAQREYWLRTSKEDIWNDLQSLLLNARKKVNGKLKPLHHSIQYLRYNESGDFFGQDCVDKLSFIALRLKTLYDITTYGYTARKDLDYTGIHFLVKGSGHDNGNNGRTIARKPDKLESNAAFLSSSRQDVYNEDGKMFAICPMDCSKCTLCKVKNNLNIVFPLH